MRITLRKFTTTAPSINEDRRYLIGRSGARVTMSATAPGPTLEGNAQRSRANHSAEPVTPDFGGLIRMPGPSSGVPMNSIPPAASAASISDSV